MLDLEGLACHKGSLLGALPGVEQPSQKAFETQLAVQIERFDLARPVYVEAESRRIGRIALPTALIERMRAAVCLEIEASAAARLDYLLEDYAYLGDEPEQLASRLEMLRELHSRETIARWQDWARTRALRPLFDELSRLHYDPAYGRSQAAHFRRWAERRTVAADTLDAAGIAQAAQALRALG